MCHQGFEVDCPSEWALLLEVSGLLVCETPRLDQPSQKTLPAILGGEESPSGPNPDSQNNHGPKKHIWAPAPGTYNKSKMKVARKVSDRTVKRNLSPYDLMVWMRSLIEKREGEKGSVWVRGFIHYSAEMVVKERKGSAQHSRAIEGLLLSPTPKTGQKDSWSNFLESTCSLISELGGQL